MDKQNRFVSRPGDFIFPQCNQCAHHHGDGTCTAYPVRIPDEIFENEVDHKQPYEGDQGIQFKQKER